MLETLTDCLINNANIIFKKKISDAITFYT